MRILLTNDDGLDAPGIAAMYDAIVGTGTRTSTGIDNTVGSALGEVFVAAPLTVQSATGHGATFHRPLMTKPMRVNDRMVGVAIDALPADCVKLALTELWQQRFGQGTRPDLLISGMNAGANYGINVIYSGTVAAALEAAIVGVPAIAVSLHVGMFESDFALAAARARATIDRILATGLLQSHACLSINIPRTPVGTDPSDTPKVIVCPMNTHSMVDRYARCTSPAGDDYYWSTHAAQHNRPAPHATQSETPRDTPPQSGFEFRQTDPGTDLAHLNAGAITVTPLSFDLTDHAALRSWQQAFTP